MQSHDVVPVIPPQGILQITEKAEKPLNLFRIQPGRDFDRFMRLPHLHLQQLFMGAPVRLNQHAVHMVRGDLLFPLATSRNQAAKAQVSAQPQVAVNAV